MPNRLALVLLAICAAGCSRGNSAINNLVVSRSPEIPADMIDKVDGIYKGEVRQVAVRSATCPTLQWGTVEIGDGTLYFAFTPSTIFITPVQPDGSIRTVLSDASLEGHIVNGRLEFAVKNPVCESRYYLRWVM